MNIATIIEQEGLQFDRYLGQTLTLPYSGFDNIRIHPNDTAIASVVNLSLKKLYDNFLYLYKSSRVASNIIPISQIAIAGINLVDLVTVTESPSCRDPDYGSDSIVLSVEPVPDIPPSPQYQRWKACYRCVDVVVNSSGSIVSSTQSGPTTSNLNLTQILIDNNLIPTLAGTYTFIFVFYGWRKWNPQGWISADDKYDILTDENTATIVAGVSGEFKWHMYSEGLSSSEFEPLESIGLYNQDNTSAMIVSENIPNKGFNIFMSSGSDFIIYDNRSNLLTVPIDAITTITPLLSTQEIYPDAGVKWKKITDFAFTDDYSLFVVDMSGNRVVKYDATGFFTDNNILKNKLVYEDSLGGFGTINDNNLFNQPYSVDVYGDYVYILDSGNYSVKKFDKNLNWISTYRQVRDFLSAFPIYLSHDSDGNMYVLTQKNLIYKYDNNFQNKVIIPLDSLSANNETYIKLEFSPYDKNIFYVLSDKNIYKKLITTPDEDVGKYLPYIFRTDTEEKYTTFSSLKGPDGDFNFVFSKSPNGAGKITIWYDNINLFDVLSVNNFDIYTYNEIKINENEYLQNWVFNKAIAKLLLNHMRLRDQITGKFIAKRDSKNNITFRGTRYFLPDELDRLDFDQDITNYIGMNEIFQNNIVNRCLERIYEIQTRLFEALAAEIESGFDSSQTVFLD